MIDNKELKKLEDFNIINGIKAGNVELFAEIIQRHEKRVYAFIIKMVKNTNIEYMAEDLCQETFYKAYRYLYTFRKKDASLSTWLHTIARHAVIDELRKSRYSIYLEDSPINLSANCEELPEFILIQNERASMVQLAIGYLPTNQKKAIILREYEGKNYEEIAKILNATTSSVKSLLFRARNSIKFALDHFMQDTS
jgi:RNA polymerase sigma factor (sigma-70 family)